MIAIVYRITRRIENGWVQIEGDKNESMWFEPNKVLETLQVRSEAPMASGSTSAWDGHEHAYARIRM